MAWRRARANAGSSALLVILERFGDPVALWAPNQTVQALRSRWNMMGTTRPGCGDMVIMANLTHELPTTIAAVISQLYGLASTRTEIHVESYK